MVNKKEFYPNVLSIQFFFICPFIETKVCSLNVKYNRFDYVLTTKLEKKNIIYCSPLSTNLSDLLGIQSFILKSLYIMFEI